MTLTLPGVVARQHGQLGSLLYGNTQAKNESAAARTGTALGITAQRLTLRVKIPDVATESGPPFAFGWELT